MSRTVAVVTLGCARNEVDSEELAGRLAADGWILVDDVEKAGEHLMFDKAWNYIKNINLDNPFHIKCIGKKASIEFLSNLNTTIIFYEALEEYEKCALLKNIENKVKEFKF